MRRFFFKVTCAALIFTIGPASGVMAADTVQLASGWSVEGDITVESEHEVKVRVNGRTMTFPRDSIADITYGPESNAPSQVAKREAEQKAQLEANQTKVEAIKIKKRKRRKTTDKKDKKEKAKEVDAVGGGLNPDGTLVVPETSTPEEEAAIELLRSKKEGDRMTGANDLRKMKSIFAIPNLIRVLDDENVHVRKAAFKALQHITQQSNGYRADERNRSERLKGVVRWQKWYEKASGKKVPW